MSRAETYRAYFEKFPAETAKEEVYQTILVSLAKKTEALEAQTEEVIKALGIVSQRLAAQGKAPEAAPAVVEEPQGSGDQTPFPAGASATGPVPVPAPPPEIPQPNVGSSPAMNAAPIPTRPKPKNGAKEPSP